MQATQKISPTTSMLAATAEGNNSKDARGSCNQPASERTTAIAGTPPTSLTLSPTLHKQQSSDDKSGRNTFSNEHWHQPEQ
jgi:hypothetical protein